MAMALCYGQLNAQSVAPGPDDVEPDIVGHIVSDSLHVIIQSEDILELLRYEKPQAKPKKQTIVYKVQVFSDNNARTAKNEARSQSHRIAARFPQFRTYVTFTSPYWRLRVGDFATQDEADAAAEQLRRAFPAYNREIRVVREQVRGAK